MKNIVNLQCKDCGKDFEHERPYQEGISNSDEIQFSVLLEKRAMLKNRIENETVNGTTNTSSELVEMLAQVEDSIKSSKVTVSFDPKRCPDCRTKKKQEHLSNIGKRRPR
jgi:predicted Zn-ribbon and HTH transcriptional regulator